MRCLAPAAPSSLEKNSRASAILPTVIASRSSRHICCCALASTRVSASTHGVRGKNKGRTFLSFVVSQPSEPCWPSERLTQFLMPALSTACSRCWLSKARFDLRTGETH